MCIMDVVRLASLNLLLIVTDYSLAVCAMPGLATSFCKLGACLCPSLTRL